MDKIKNLTEVPTGQKKLIYEPKVPFEVVAPVNKHEKQKLLEDIHYFQSCGSNEEYRKVNSDIERGSAGTVFRVKDIVTSEDLLIKTLNFNKHKFKDSRGVERKFNVSDIGDGLTLQEIYLYSGNKIVSEPDCTKGAGKAKAKDLLVLADDPNIVTIRRDKPIKLYLENNKRSGSVKSAVSQVVMDYVDATNLNELEFVDKATFDNFIKSMHQLLLAIEVIHAQGLIHADIKPKNIMIDKDYKNAKLIDFGLALKVKDTKYGSRPLTDSGRDDGVLIGTPQVSDLRTQAVHKVVTQSGDLTAWAVTLLERLGHGRFSIISDVADAYKHPIDKIHVGSFARALSNGSLGDELSNKNKEFLFNLIPLLKSIVVDNYKKRPDAHTVRLKFERLMRDYGLDVPEMKMDISAKELFQYKRIEEKKLQYKKSRLDDPASTKLERFFVDAYAKLSGNAKLLEKTFHHLDMTIFRHNIAYDKHMIQEYFKKEIFNEQYEIALEEKTDDQAKALNYADKASNLIAAKRMNTVINNLAIMNPSLRNSARSYIKHKELISKYTEMLRLRSLNKDFLSKEILKHNIPGMGFVMPTAIERIESGELSEYNGINLTSLKEELDTYTRKLRLENALLSYESLIRKPEQLNELVKKINTYVQSMDEKLHRVTTSELTGFIEKEMQALKQWSIINEYRKNYIRLNNYRISKGYKDFDSMYKSAYATKQSFFKDSGLSKDVHIMMRTLLQAKSNNKAGKTMSNNEIIKHIHENYSQSDAEALFKNFELNVLVLKELLSKLT